MKSSRNFHRSVAASTVTAIGLLAIANSPAMAQTHAAQPAGANNIMEFALTIRNTTEVLAKVEIGRFLQLNKDADATPAGSLSPVLVDSEGIVVRDVKFRPFGFGSKLAIEYDAQMKSDYLNVFDESSAKRLRGKYGTFIALCEAGEPTEATCFRITNMRVSYTPIGAQASGTANSVIEMMNRISSDAKNGASITITNSLYMVNLLTAKQKFSGSTPQSYARWLTPELKDSLVQKTNLKQQQDAAEAAARKERAAVEAERRKQEAEAEAAKAEVVLKNSAPGTYIFCSSSSDYLVSATDPIHKISFTCDLTKEMQLNVRKLTDAGWDIVGETRKPLEKMLGGTGYVVEMRFKKVK